MGLLRAFVLTGAMLAAAPGAAQTAAELRAEITALSGAVAELARELSSGDGAAPLADDSAPLPDRVAAIEARLARLTDRAERLENRIRGAIDDASRRLGDLEFRLTELEGGDPSALPAPARLGERPQADATAPASAEQRAYDDAVALADSDPARAIAALQDFLAAWPASPLAAQAGFELATLARAERRESDAARAYLGIYSAAPDGPDAPRALLGLGESLARLDQTDDACAMLDALRTRFPDSDQAAAAQDRAAQLNCA